MDQVTSSKWRRCASCSRQARGSTGAGVDPARNTWLAALVALRRRSSCCRLLCQGPGTKARPVGGGRARGGRKAPCPSMAGEETYSASCNLLRGNPRYTKVSEYRGWLLARAPRGGRRFAPFARILGIPWCSARFVGVAAPSRAAGGAPTVNAAAAAAGRKLAKAPEPAAWCHGWHAHAFGHSMLAAQPVRLLWCRHWHLWPHP